MGVGKQVGFRAQQVRRASGAFGVRQNLWLLDCRRMMASITYVLNAKLFILMLHW